MHTADTQVHAVDTGFLRKMAVICLTHCSHESTMSAAGLHRAEVMLTESCRLHRLGGDVSQRKICSRHYILRQDVGSWSNIEPRTSSTDDAKLMPSSFVSLLVLDVCVDSYLDRPASRQLRRIHFVP